MVSVLDSSAILSSTAPKYQKKYKNHKNTKKLFKQKKKQKKKNTFPILQPATPERYEAMPCPIEAIEGALPELTSLCEGGFTGRERLVNSDFLWFRGISR
jgi:hypothetical protein